MGKLLDKNTVNSLRSNPSQITDELLQQLRRMGNDGKDSALELLDIEKDEEMYYLDAFGQRISYNGNRGLKKEFTQLNLTNLHISELKKCSEDIHYFKDYYVKITTQEGTTFPTIRDYQNDFLTAVSDDSEDLLCLMPRQSGKSVTTAIYLAWIYTFKKSINIGICANAGKTAREFLDKTKKIISYLPMWMQSGTRVWNKTGIENENEVKILTDVPSSDPFRGFSIHCLVVDECAFIPTDSWMEFSDSVFPSQSGLAWKKNIMISTANGKNHFYEMVRDARDGKNGMTLFEVDWKQPPRFKKDGTLWDNEEFKKSIIQKNGLVHFNQNYANDFVGSSMTLIDTEVMQDLKPKQALYTLDRKLKIYEEAIKGERYIMTVDPAKDGSDFFAVGIFKVTKFPFLQVASSKIQVNYLNMPSFLYEWAEQYNFAYMIIENNEGAGQSIADVLFKEYEYENLHFDKKIGTKTRQNKEYPGFRTTKGNRNTLISTMKTFIENGKLIISDVDLIEEFTHFLLIKNKYQADTGYHDDLIMSTALLFSPFLDVKNFEDFRSIVDVLYDRNEDFDEDISDSFIFGVFDQDYSEDRSEFEAF